MELVRALGSSREAGYQIGESLRSLISWNCEHFCPTAEARGLKAMIRQYETSLQKICPRLLDEHLTTRSTLTLSKLCRHLRRMTFTLRSKAGVPLWRHFPKGLISEVWM